MVRRSHHPWQRRRSAAAADGGPHHPPPPPTHPPAILPRPACCPLVDRRPHSLRAANERAPVAPPRWMHPPSPPSAGALSGGGADQRRLAGPAAGPRQMTRLRGGRVAVTGGRCGAWRRGANRPPPPSTAHYSPACLPTAPPALPRPPRSARRPVPSRPTSRAPSFPRLFPSATGSWLAAVPSPSPRAPCRPPFHPLCLSAAAAAASPHRAVSNSCGTRVLCPTRGPSHLLALSPPLGSCPPPLGPRRRSASVSLRGRGVVGGAGGWRWALGAWGGG